ncbi:cobalamin-binding protein [Candidatus Aerophobetes bacterium]|uniref:Cobalamin-binding protein n=1 Tax=Aerophobetes bacterium TaxID=2030807 RepID=A0A523S5B2_UNCAE|nr:MAG: cobalamin-binding protein [Candidatus Aerophobetes bacterium]
MGMLEEIYNAIVEGKVDDAARGVERALDSGIEADDILKKSLTSAMDLVGVKFGEGEMFIPHVVWSAKAMQAGMDLLKPHFSISQQSDRARIIIGTTKGDIHDIGKNLVTIMLEGAGFKVFDLGVDVEPNIFVEKALQEKGDIIALSSLLTTTMLSMRDVVSLAKEKGLSSTKVIIGGAPVDMAFCKEIGADAYGIDAMDAVRKVRDLLE